MAGFKAPDFNERAAAAKQAKLDALQKLRAKPPLDEAVVAARIAAKEAKDRADAAKREAKRVAAEEAKALAEAEAEQARAEAEQRALVDRAADRPKPTEAELKAARDARYAARKARKK